MIIQFLLSAVSLPLMVQAAKVVPVDAAGDETTETNYTPVGATVDLEKMMKSQEMTASGSILPRDAMEALDAADAAAGRDKWGVAMRQIQIALEAAPGSPIVLEKAAMMYGLTGKQDRALSCWEALLEKDDEDVRARHGVARALLRLDRADEALVHLIRLYKEDRDNVAVKYLVIVAHTVNNQASDVVTLIDRLSLQERAYVAANLADDQDWLLELRPGERYARLAADAMTWAGRSGQEAVTEAELAVLTDRLRAQSTELFRLEASIHKRDFEQAEEVLRRVRTRGIQDPSLRAYHAIVQAAVGDGDRASTLRDLRELRTRHADQANVLHYCGLAYLEAAEGSQAVEVLQKAHTLEPDDVDIRLSLVAALMDSGAVGATWAELDDIAKEDPAAVQQWLRSGGERMERMRRDSRCAALLDRLK